VVDPAHVSRAGIAVFKRALHWSELIGPGIVQSIPYTWWKQFEGSDIEVRATLDEPMDPAVVDSLSTRFADFRRAYGVDTLPVEEFARFGPTIHTLNQFIGGYQDLLGLVRERMLR
jgi:transaldolase